MYQVADGIFILVAAKSRSSHVKITVRRDVPARARLGCRSRGPPAPTRPCVDVRAGVPCTRQGALPCCVSEEAHE